MDKNQKIVIIGAVASGSKCAFKLKREKPDFNIVIYTADDMVSYSSCGLPFFIGGQIKDGKNLVIRQPEAYLSAGINLHLKHKLLSVDTKNKTVEILDIENNKTFTDNYDKLVLATGARPFIPKTENSDLENIFTLRTIHDGIKIREQMLKSKTALIIGGGYIGIELLEAFIKNGLNVKLVEFSEHIMSLFDSDIASIIENHITSNYGDKVEIINSDCVKKFIGENGKVTGAITQNGRELQADMVIFSVGVVPNTEYLKGTQIKTGIKNSICVNKHLQTNIPDIYAIGDCAEKTNLVSNTPCWIPLGSTANKEGRCCAINLAGNSEEFSGVLGSAVTRFLGFTMSITGLNETTAKKAGYDVITETVTKKDKAGYMPEVKNITIKVVANKKDGKILGAQAIGCGDADKRVNTVAAALNDGKKVQDLINLDMTYAPPYSPTIDPLLTAFMNLKEKLKN